MGKGLNVLFWNVRSIYNKLDSIRHEVNNMQPDILNMSETWLNENICSNEIALVGYTILRNDKNRNTDGTIKKGGGICTFIKEGISCDLLENITCMDGNIEITGTKYKLPFTRDILIFNVYRPPSGDVEIFLKYLQFCVSSVRNDKECDIFIGGDYNIDFHKKNSIEMKKLTKFMKTNQLKQIIDNITRPDSNTCIDLILTNCDIVMECVPEILA